jgi:ribosomal protein L18E
VALTVEAERFSASARQKIEAAGGKVNELNPAPAKEEKEAPKASPAVAAAEPAEAEQEPET